MKKHGIFIFAALALLFLSCAVGEDQPAQAEEPDEVFVWNGLQLIRENIDYGFDIFLYENVITIEDQTLECLIESRGATQEYGVAEFIQVNLDGAWYTVLPQLPQREEPLNLWAADSIRYTVDFSVIGGLPAGKYRLVEKFFDERFKSERYGFAYFWVTERGGERPPESEREGGASKEDIVLYAQSLYEARRAVTDRDIWFAAVTENLSGKKYIAEQKEAVLETRQNGEWVKIDYKHINLGLLSEWRTERSEIFLNEPLPAGRYRIRIKMYVFDMPRASYKGQPGGIEVECEFDVTAHEEAPEPVWDPARLSRSENTINAGVKMALTNPVIDADNTALEITLTADKLYHYGEAYEVEVLLGGKWYKAPFASGAFNEPLYIIDPKSKEHSKNIIKCDPVLACGVLPAGQYRIIKEFTTPNDSPPGGNFSKEFAVAEFTMAETLSSEEAYVNMHK